MPCAFVRSFSSEEQLRLGMAQLAEALREAEALSGSQLEAARQLRRGYRLKQTAETPEELKEAMELHRKAFTLEPRLRQVLQQVALAESRLDPRLQPA